MSEINILLTGCIPYQESLADEREKYGREVLSYYYSFSPMKQVINNADFTIGSISTEYSYPDDLIRELKTAGFDYLSLGIGEDDDINADTLFNTLNKFGIAHPEGRKIGTSIIDVKGIRIGIISCTFNDAYKDLNILAEALEKVEELDKQKVDFKICYVSWKFNIYFGLALDERQRGIAKILANMGIDYIVGAGPLFPMKYEIIKGSWNHFTHVAYSLGNLLYCSNNYNRNTSAVINLKITKDNNGKISSSDSYLPCYTWKTLGHHRRRVQFLNNRTYTKKGTNTFIEWRKLFVSSRLGDGIHLCHEFDVNENNSEQNSDSDNVLQDDYYLERINESSCLQNKMLDSYRLTEEFRKLYGEMLYSNERYNSIIKGAEHFIRINYPEVLKRDDAKDIIIDMIYTRDVLGFSNRDYFAFHFEDKSIIERLEYVSDAFKINYYRRLNTDTDENYQLNHKWTCYERLKDLYKREIIYIDDKEQYSLFVDFAQKYDKFITKPVFNDQGRGIRIYDRNDYGDLKDLFDKIFTRIGPFVCEELIKARKYIADIHPQSCNTVRLYTYNDNGEIKFVVGLLKAGTGGAVVDNANYGGIVAAINIESGVVECDAADEFANTFKRHPDTGITFNGFKIEDWDLLKGIIAEAAKRFPTVKFIGWDAAHGEDGWQIIEGNPQGMMWVYQLSTGKGMRKELEDIIGW